MKHINRSQSGSSSKHNLSIDHIIKKYKIVFLGEASVGKTSICSSYRENKFISNQEATIGASFFNYYY